MATKHKRDVAEYRYYGLARCPNCEHRPLEMCREVVKGKSDGPVLAVRYPVCGKDVIPEF